MSDLKGIEISDVFGLSQPLAKLVETVEHGIGKWYEPIHVRRMANAKAKEINIIGDAVRVNSDLPMSYQYGNVLVDASSEDNLLQRAQNRKIYQEKERQQNIESVIEYAYNELKTEETVSEIPVDEDWITRFFNIVENVNSEDMKVIWAKILAGEIKSPQSCSMRTMERLRNIRKDEAEVFKKIASLLLYDKNTVYYISNPELQQKYGISADDLLTLDDCGLLNCDSMIMTHFSFSKTKSDGLRSRKRMLEINSGCEEEKEISVNSNVLTRAGSELFRILGFETNEDYIVDVAELICRQLVSVQAIISVYEIQNEEENRIKLNSEPIVRLSV